MTREEAIEILQAIKFIVDFEDYSDRLEIAIDMAIEDLKRPHGEWIESDDGDEIYGRFEQCSKCYSLVLSTHMNFCWNCGVDFREGEKNENRN